jgi:hypothetical protein
MGSRKTPQSYLLITQSMIRLKKTSYLPSIGSGKIQIKEKMKRVNKKELLKQVILISIFMTFITVLTVSKGETYFTYTDSPCEDYDYRQQWNIECENWNEPTLVNNILYNDNGEINIIIVSLFWISLTAIGVVIVFQKLTSEHVLSGKCMAKKKSGEGFCSRNQLPGKLYCKQHLKENRFRIKKQG